MHALPLVLLSLVQSQQGEAKRLDFEKMRLDLETMRRILDREARGVPETAAEGDFITLHRFLASAQYVSTAGGAGASEAFYLPGEGALFLLRVGFPVASSDASSVDGEEAREPTLWEKVRAEVEGSPLPSEPKKEKPYDSKKVEDLKTRILDALGKYAGNIGQLRDGERLTVVVSGEGGSDPLYSVTVGGTGRAVRSFRAATALDPSGTVVATTGRSSTVLTIQVACRDIAAFAAGRFDRAAFAECARICQY